MRRLRESLWRLASRLGRRRGARPFGATTPIDPIPSHPIADLARAREEIRALKAEMDRSLFALRAWGLRLDRRLRELDRGGEPEALRALGQVAGGVAHNLNNALATILGYTELLLKDSPDEPTERRLAVIRQVVLEASVTVRRLQDLAARQPEGTPGPVALDQVVAEALETTQPRWRDESERRGVTIRIVEELGLTPPVEGSHAELRQALIHLILSAVDAMPGGGTLTLRSLSPEPGWVLVEVADTGAARAVRLAEAEAAVERAGGRLEVEAGGALVRLRLAESRLPLIPAESQVERCPPERARRILLVDDDPRLLRALADLLEASGHTVLTAASGAEGLSRFEEDPVDLVITDLGMPGLTGRELAERIRARAPGVPVFLLTGWGEALADADLAGVVDRIIAKPVSADAILHHVGEVPRARAYG